MYRLQRCSSDPAGDLPLILLCVWSVVKEKAYIQQLQPQITTKHTTVCLNCWSERGWWVNEGQRFIRGGERGSKYDGVDGYFYKNDQEVYKYKSNSFKTSLKKWKYQRCFFTPPSSKSPSSGSITEFLLHFMTSSQPASLPHFRSVFNNTTCIYFTVRIQHLKKEYSVHLHWG